MRHSLHLEQTIDRMAPYVPWYQSWIRSQLEREAGVTAGEELPLVTASVLEAHYYVADHPLALRSDIHRYQTSGTSSGLRKSIYYSRSDEENYLRIKLDVYRTILGPYDCRTALADMGTGHAEATAVEVFRRLGMNAESISFRLPIQQHLERLACLKPEVLYTMPSILNRILLESPDPAAYGIRHVILVGEMASPAWLSQAAQRLGIGTEGITDTYGSIEIGTIAYYSHEHGRYLFAEGIEAEGLQPEEIEEGLDPLSDEGERVLVLTSTVREAFPAIRYVTYDVVRDLRPILVDGSPRQSFRSIVKRIGPDLKHGEKISIYDIENVVYRHIANAGVRVKVAGNAIIVYLFSPDASETVIEQIRCDVENHIPEIGMMIRAGIINGIQVLRGTYEDTYQAGSIKNKKIFYE
ncbi:MULTISPECIES: phenylacetate--CoA ligase family protein [Paenibacillus]|uniref:CoF synthetase n=1 Tax=Paenibacillus TaxID=44249 RepID=UPI0022B92D92|nr:CoF synthetase [Paenibacillus caseinilyticus]MCZ8521325.1 CoF synthetase [Paenibacillus caseinilyticus]